METHSSPFDRIVVNAVSPDRSVKAKGNARAITVELVSQVLGGHDESSLSTQCGAAVTRARVGMARALAKIAGSDDADTDTDTDTESPELKRMKERFAAEIEALTTSGTSGPATVELTGRDRADVRFRPRTVQYLSAEQLAGHINTALAEALRAWDAPILDMYMRAFDSDESTTVKGH